MGGKALVEQLEKSGYFEYTNEGNLAAVKNAIIKHYDSGKEFMTEFNHESPFQSFDLRFYSCGDCEELYEEGGVIAMIEEMQPFLKKNHIQLNYADDTYDGEGHSITVNNSTYMMADGAHGN